jgi:hypothetical protein
VGGCTNCKGKSGCDDRKGAMFATLDATLAALYPTRTWGELDDGAIASVEPADIAALADELATELDAATFVVPGDEHEPCDRVYVLALGRPPCALQVRDHGVAAPPEWAELDAIREHYLRISISQLAPVVAVQQVEVAVDRTSYGHGDGGYAITERPRAGVFDAPVLRRMQRLVAVLPAYDLVHLDFGEIAGPPAGFAPGSWPAAWGAGAPSIWSYLFSPEPASTATTVVVPAAVRVRHAG